MQFRFFPSFFDRPTKMRFAEQEVDEIIELLLRQHWVVNVPWIFYSILAILLPFVVYNLRNLIGIPFIGAAPVSLQIAVLTVWYLIILAYAIESFLHWYFNIYIVTNQHLVDVDLESLLSPKVTEAEVADIQSAAFDVKGLIRSFFNFGNVVIQTAAESQQITFNNIPYPAQVVDRVNDLRQAAQREQRGGGI